MKKLPLLILFLALLFPIYGQTEKKITILHTNDLHSRLMGYAPESAYTPLTVNDDKTVGGFSRIAAIIKKEKESDNGITLVVDAGDFLMGTLFQSLEVKTGFQLRLMKTMGYDVACLGNHEFDYGPGKLASIISAGSAYGNIPPMLFSNAVFNKKMDGDDSLEELFRKNIVSRKLIINRDGLRIGFFSLIGVVADDNAALAPPVTFSKQIPLARQMVKELKSENCDVIICLSHSGVSDNGKGGWEGEDVELAEKVKGINVIISGHTHTFLEQPIIVNGIPVVQAGEYGKDVGKLSLTFNNGNITVNNYILIPVNDNITGDKAVQQLIEEQKKMVDTEILQPLGMNYNLPVAESGFLLECNEMGDIEGSNLGPMVADAIYNYVNNHSDKGTDMSMVAVGVIRDQIVPGEQTAADIFRIMSMGTGDDFVPGYPLSRLYVTGRELKSVLEILQVAYKSTPANYCYYSGIRVEFNPEKGMLRKISKIEIVKPDGRNQTVDFSKKNKSLYSITANSYMLEFIGIIKKMSYGLINVVPKDFNGNRVSDMKTMVIDMNKNVEGIQEGKEWLALMEFLGSMKDTNGNGIPDVDYRYAGPVKCFFPVDVK